MADFNDPTGPWWQHAVCYQVYVRSFADSDGDGIGDLPGVTARLPYLRDLGVDAIWLTPFYTSPQHDGGYDVADYTDVDRLFGTLADADELIGTAHDLGLKVIVDIVPNHTSSDHAWFQAALAAAPGSPERARYLFRPGRGEHGELPPNNWGSVFGGAGWSRVTEADGAPGEWYLHIFDSTQPDLNWRNPQVPEMFEGVLRFWLDRGADGFRIDVAHGLVKEESLRDQELAPDEETVLASAVNADGGMVDPHVDDEPMWDQPEVHEIYRSWRRILDSYPGDRMAVAEAWTKTPEALARYLRPDELPQAFNFHFLVAPWSARRFAEVIRQTLAQVDSVGASPTWVLSNHDVVRHPSRYGGGASGLARARAATLAMLALPGSAYLYQGEELGLEQQEVAPQYRQDPAWFRTGEPGRDGCRVPLPWNGDAPPFGFTTGEAWIPQPPEWARLTAERQQDDPDSTLSLYRRALALRRTFAVSAGDQVTIEHGHKKVLTFHRGPITVMVNCRNRKSARLPKGALLLASGPLDGDRLPPDTAAWVHTG